MEKDTLRKKEQYDLEKKKRIELKENDITYFKLLSASYPVTHKSSLLPIFDFIFI